jgi:membrane protease YdiL (CAAX protease family)
LRIRAYIVLAAASLGSIVLGLWVIPLLGTLVLYPVARNAGVIALNEPWIRRPHVIGATVALAGISLLGIGMWLGSKGLFVVPVVPKWFPDNEVLIVSVLVVASLVNAFYEEAFWRLLFWDHATGPRWPGAVFLSVAFGVIHLSAIPDGCFGAVLVAGFSLGAFGLRVLARGSIVPGIAAHFIADLFMLLSLANLG